MPNLTMSVILPLLTTLIPISFIAVALWLRRTLRNKRLQRLDRLDALNEALGLIGSCRIENCDAAAELITSHEIAPLEGLISQLQRDSELRYRSRWLPPLEPHINGRILSGRGPSADLMKPLVFLLIGTTVSFLNYAFALYSAAPYALACLLIPLLTAVMASLLLLEDSLREQKDYEDIATKTRATFASVLPVFNDQSGVALIVDQMLDYDLEMRKSLDQFNATAKQMADADFAEGICTSVQEIMSTQIAPPIRQSSEQLSDLAQNLDRRQQEGMADLAGHFANSLAESLSRHLNPIESQLREFSSMMQETRNFIDDSVAVLENSRQQNIVLNRELSESLKLMTIAKNDMANEMAEISDNLKVISVTTEKMTALYAGEENNLSDKINRLSQSLDTSLRTLDQGIRESSASIQLATRLKAEQEGHNREVLGELNRIIEELNIVGESMRSSSRNFTQESSAYVNQTLKGFDNGLAEVVERLIFTASAIRDAVDALPVALRPGKE